MPNDGQFGTHVETSIYEEYPVKLQSAMWRMLGELIQTDQWSSASSIINRFFDSVRKLTESYKWRFELGQLLRASVSPSATPSAGSPEMRKPAHLSSPSAEPVFVPETDDTSPFPTLDKGK